MFTDNNHPGSDEREPEETYLVSFGGQYKHTPHAVLGYWPELGEDAVLEVQARDVTEARAITHNLIGPAWCAIYGPTDPPGWDYKNLGSLEAAVAEPRDSSWTVGVQLTVNADGTLELHVEDVTADLYAEGAPVAVVEAFDEITDRNRPSVRWVPRD